MAQKLILTHLLWYKAFKLTSVNQDLFDGIDDSLKRLGVVHGEVSKNLAVETDVLLRELAHELGISDTVLTGGGVDSLDPKGTEITLLGLAVTVGVSQTFLVSVLSYGPDIPSGEEITAGSLENLLAASPRGY